MKEFKVNWYQSVTALTKQQFLVWYFIWVHFLQRKGSRSKMCHSNARKKHNDIQPRGTK